MRAVQKGYLPRQAGEALGVDLDAGVDLVAGRRANELQWPHLTHPPKIKAYRPRDFKPVTAVGRLAPGAKREPRRKALGLRFPSLLGIAALPGGLSRDSLITGDSDASVA
jgi:hypothetical protein